MQAYVRRYKPFLVFLAKFFLTYLVLGLCYQFFLTRFDESKKEIDSITLLVARQSEFLLQTVDANAVVVPHDSNPYMKLIYDGNYVARIIEGCNAVSVMILFTAFVVAFAGPLRSTAIFIVSGCIVIHVLNIARIALLAAAIHKYPEHEHFLHGVIFPLFIYGVVFMLWVIWVNRFSYHSNAKN